MRQQLFKIALMFPLLFSSQLLFCQQCNNRFTSIIYKGISFDSFTCSISTAANEIIAAGNIIDDHGFVARFSTKGTPLFSYQYNPVYQFNTTYYKTLKFTDLIQTKDGGFVLAGNTIQDKWIFQAEFVNRVGVLLKIDRYGNVVWSQRLESANGTNNSGFELAATSVVEAANGDLVAYVASNYGKNYPAYGRIVCFTAGGVQKWNTLLATNDFDGGLKGLDSKRALLQGRDGSILIGDMLYKTNRSAIPMSTVAAQLHFLSLDASTGKIKWETNYQYPLPVSARYADVTSATEQSNGNIVFTISAYTSASAITKGLRIATNNKGVVQLALAYNATTNTATKLVDVTVDKNGNQTYLFKNDNDASIAKVSGTGAILWQKGFSNSGGRFPVNCFTETGNGYGVLMSNFDNWESRLLLTDTAGVIDCANVPSQLHTEPVSLLPGGPLVTDPNIPDQNRFGTANFPLRADAYPLQKRIECEEQTICCHDVIDSMNTLPVTICEGSSFTLPDNTVVKESGTYYVTYKTPGGCDSIRFYKVKVDKNLAALTLGNDLCLEEHDSITLTATAGYGSYYWMNDRAVTTNEFKASRAGTYWVTVVNSCGTKTDSVTVFQTCDFPIYMPSAFSPNGDGKNDVFGVPPLNKNNFVSLKIFNRWGNLIFNSKDAAKGWDGTLNGTRQATGIFVYYVEMEGLSGKKLSQKGTVLLVR